MSSLRLALSILCVYFTSYAAGRDPTGNMTDKNGKCLYFPVTADAKITTSGEIKVPVAEISWSDEDPFFPVPESSDTAINAPFQLMFPFTTSPLSTNYSCLKFNCILTTTNVQASGKIPYHWDCTFKLIKRFLVDSQNSKIEHTIFATETTLSKTVTIFAIENLVLQVGTRWLLTDQDKKAVDNMRIASTSLAYLGGDNPQKTPFTFIKFWKA